MKLPCYLVRDLLPLYKDEVCESETAADLQEHLEHCPDCRALWERMQETALLEGEAARAREKEQADALQRVRKDQRKKRMLTVLAAVLVTLCAVYLGLRLLHDYANHTYLDYDVDDILKVEYEEHPEEGENPLEGDGLYITLNPTKYSSLSRTAFLDTEEGKVLVFTLGNSLWNKWMGTQWYGLKEGELFKEGICTVGNFGRSIVDELEAAYYLPNSEFEDWESHWVSSVPDKAVLVWQRDAG